MTSALNAKLKATDISPLIGSAIHLGKDALLSGEYAADLREMLERRGVLVFPLVKFTETLGTAVPEMAGELHRTKLQGEEPFE